MLTGQVKDRVLTLKKGIEQFRAAQRGAARHDAAGRPDAGAPGAPASRCSSSPFSPPAAGRPPDEAWLRFLGFRAERRDHDAGVLKRRPARRRRPTRRTPSSRTHSLYVGQQGGTGILVNRARIDYRMAGFSPPAAEYPVNLYLAGRPPTAQPSTGAR